ncbi:Dolichyl-phosphate-mannose-protein mannosyltransferase-domain-containing protein [Syncephalastrum racemosum]|uniref:Dolichyl-phosphate-mannose--protein mannosyltransferase n=1 Tax=Syncephalastrum racemosum TaxID=13706 RepID=A0A1X2HS41_SYNRA|nr:Dolichyl-phosphate-mannose-protein mannosyltransferase-domain-containing protein [Syncephalastrum racemosum]
MLKQQDVLSVLSMTLLALWTRFRVIGKSNTVVWDEAHFGKFGSYYLKHEFYFDVHPPLGKMLVGLSGYLAGYDGSFSFESGKEYPENLDYTFMRVFNATWGALLVPLAYMTARQFHFSQRASLLTSTMVLLDTAYLCISRFILLDSMLLFFTCTTLYCLSVFHNVRFRPFSLKWWTWLGLTGASLGCVLSVKWVGLFAVALVGTYTIEELWDMFGDLSMPKPTYVSHWIARVICLLCLPMAIYMASFKAHFIVLNKSGPGDTQMSSLFQAHLQGNSFNENPLDIAFGSRVTIKNFAYGGGLLHSHVQKYPEGSKRQQITCYHHKDNNNEWVFQPYHGQSNIEYDEDEQGEEDDGAVQFIKDGDTVRLVHDQTGKNLHASHYRAPLTSAHFEVSGHGEEGESDAGADWRVEVVSDLMDADIIDQERIHALSTRIRFRHAQLGCLLAADNKQLPEWGFRQIEVTCDPSKREDDPHTWWNIEEHRNPKLPPAPRDTYQSRFLSDFWQLNTAMWRSNNALIPDPDKDDLLTSTPTQWPLASVGLRMCGWADDNIKFYLLGNPIVWWSSTVSLAIFALAITVYNVRHRRQAPATLSQNEWEQFVYVGKTIFMGWFLHYVPFFIMGRVMYLHHYFPALYFSMFMVPFLLEHFTRHCSKRTSRLVFGVAFTAVIVAFLQLHPVAYGMEGPIEDYASLRWIKSWNMLDTM